MNVRPAPIFNRRYLRPGLVLHGRDCRPGFTFGRTIRTTLTTGMRKINPAAAPVWGNHDALVVRMPDGRLGIGDSAPWRARITPLEEYEREMAAGRYAVRILESTASPSQEERAAQWWTKHVNGSLYDFRAFPSLLLMHLQGRLERRPRNWRFAFWCTEGCRKAYAAGAGLDPWQNEHPTPLTTEKRAWPCFFNEPARQFDDPWPAFSFHDVTALAVRNSQDWELIAGDWRPI